ncbi:MAG: hypothetical protein QNK04_21945 [Myxococcota bacterium]|nr:hypothetical protein [Myxococcota bacterium]
MKVPEAFNTVGFFCCSVGLYSFFYMAYTGVWNVWIPAGALIVVGAVFFLAARTLDR